MEDPDAIIAAAIRVFGRRGFRATTTKAIAEEAGVNEVTLFRRFGTKATLWNAVLSHLERAPLHALPHPPREPEAELAGWLVGTRERIYELAGLFEGADENEAARLREVVDRRMDLVRGELVRYLRSAVRASDAELRGAADLMIHAIVGEVVLSRSTTSTRSPERALARIILAGLGGSAT